MRLNAMQSLQVLIQYVRDESKNKDMADNYNALFMIDFIDLVQKKPNELDFFLNEPEKLAFDNESACNMEQEFFSTRLKKFSAEEKIFL